MDLDSETQNGIDYLDGLMARAAPAGRPFVTLSFAQSLDGCLSGPRRSRYAMSGEEALVFTHLLRDRHDAILVGIGTAIADDPRLTVRHIAGRNPQPVVMDSKLRLPVGARLLTEHPLPPWIMTTDEASGERARALEDAGARVFRLPPNERGGVDAGGVLRELAAAGIGSVMIEGGAGIIGSFLIRRFVDVVIVTICPVIAGGVRAVDIPRDVGDADLPELSGIRFMRLGRDIVLMGVPRWERGPAG